MLLDNLRVKPAKDEDVVFLYGAAHSCAGKYVVEPRDALEARRYEWCFIYVRQGVQCRVAFRSANSSVPGIGTRWRHEVDYGTGVAPIFGPEVVRRDLIFLNEVWV